MKGRNRIHAESGFRFSLLIPLDAKLAKFQEKWGPQNKIWEKKRGEGNSLPVLYPHTLV